jgi:hypothetical protein
MISLSGQATTILQETAEAMAKTWQPSLDELSERWRQGNADWQRVFPGLVALVGLKTLLWPRWIDLALAQLPSDSQQDLGISPDDLYCPSSADEGQDQWHTCFHGVNGQAAWLAVHAPGLTHWENLLQTLLHKDVLKTLGTLDARGKVIPTGSGSERLRPLTGKSLSGGEDTLGLPICDCDVVVRSLPDWLTGVSPLIPLMSHAMGALRKAEPSLSDQDWVALAQAAFGRLAWHIWQNLLDTGCIQTGRPAKQSFLAKLFTPFTPPPFAGVMILWGDHFLLWQKLKAELSQ